MKDRDPDATATVSSVSDDPGATRDLSGDLTRLVSETHAEDAARARARERALRLQATEDATLVGLLVDLAEAGSQVSERARSGRTTQGHIGGLGRDFIAVCTATGRDTLVRLSAISTIRGQPGQRLPDPSRHRVDVEGASLGAHLAGLAPERPRVAIVVEGEPAVLTGDLRAVGTDVACLEVDGDPPLVAYVALDSLSEVVILASG